HLPAWTHEGPPTTTCEPNVAHDEVRDANGSEGWCKKLGAARVRTAMSEVQRDPAATTLPAWCAGHYSGGALLGGRRANFDDAVCRRVATRSRVSRMAAASLVALAAACIAPEGATKVRSPDDREPASADAKDPDEVRNRPPIALWARRSVAPAALARGSRRDRGALGLYGASPRVRERRRSSDGGRARAHAARSCEAHTLCHRG